MPGDVVGWSCSCEVIVGSPSPLDEEAVSPEEVAKALEKAILSVRGARVRGARSTFRVREVHVYRVAPTLTAIRKKLGLKTPWAR